MAGGEPESGFTFRPARIEDCEALARLSTVLGYPSMPEQVARRLEAIVENPNHWVCVAVKPQGEIVGWLHARISHLVESDQQVEIGGLVVDESYQGRGVGRRLMERAEAWAREKGCRSVYVRSNVIRQGAHLFYQKLGYSILKTQFAFRKSLPP
jgi:GNAT superfamily N-acetyltransferase